MLKELSEFIRPDFAGAERVIAVGDVHGQIGLLRDLVEKRIRFNPESDVLVFLGDYIDRGRSMEDEIATVNYLIDLHNANRGKVVLLRGNHEQMAINNLHKKSTSNDLWLWNANGSNFSKTDDPILKAGLHRFCDALPLYIEDEWVFVHAGASMNIALEKQSENVLLWYRSENNYGYFGKRLIVGHTIHPTIQKSEMIVYVDTGAFRDGVLSAYDAKNDVEYSTRE